jgi:hypothetical protein
MTAPVLPYLPPRPCAYRPKIALIGCGSISEYHRRAYGPILSEQMVELHTAQWRATVPLKATWFTGGFQGAMGELLCAIEDNRVPTHGTRDNLRGLALCNAALANADTGTPMVPGQVTQISK